MSHSTQVRVNVGPTVVEYTFGSGTPASAYGVYEIGKPLMLTGHSALGAINAHVELLPVPELEFVRGCVQRWYDFIGFDPEYEEQNQRLRDQVWVSITRFD
jgi:hypothetical protein